MQVVTVSWGWFFVGTVGLVPWVGKAVPWEVVLCNQWRYRGEMVLRCCRGVGTVGGEAGTVGGGVVQVVAAPWGHGTPAVPWGWYRGWGRRYRGRWCCAGTVRAVPWERRCGGTVGMVLRRYRGVGTVGGEGGTVGLVPWEGGAVGGDVVQVVAVPWGHGTSAVPWGWYRGWGRRYRGR